MSYNKMTIYSAISKIGAGCMYLPAIQRRFVWEKGKIELLFDSIMRGYPFGTFLFWELPKMKAEDYVFYKFKEEYDERTPFNDRYRGGFTKDSITGVLDGQQRLSAVCIGLQGIYTERGFRQHETNPNAYQPTQLHLNLLSLPYRESKSGGLEQVEDDNFEFRFLSKIGATTMMRPSQKDRERKESVYWFHIGEMMKGGWCSDSPDIDYYIDDMIKSCSDPAQAEAVSDARRKIRHGLYQLHSRIHKDDVINFFEIAKDNIEDVLKIFVRVNSGGKVLTQTDLLFSTIVATWNEGREEIEELQKTINAMGQKFGFNTDYLMRCCLVLSDVPVTFKVHSFKSENVAAIRKQWSDIKAAITKMVALLVEFGFSKDTLASSNATIPIAYYIYKGGSLDLGSKKEIRLYLVHALLKHLFGKSPDQILHHWRGVLRSDIPQADGRYALREDYKHFNFRRFAEVSLPNGQSLKVTSEDIERFLELRKGPAFSVLQLLYPNLRYPEIVFHQDHMHPVARFDKKGFEAIGLVDGQEQKRWVELCDQVPNLQLLEGVQNQSKNATPLAEWFSKMPVSEQQKFRDDNFIPQDVTLDFASFPKFFSERKEILRKKLSEILFVTESVAVTDSDTQEIERVSDEDMEQSVFQG